MKAPDKVLYLSYDGMTDPLGESQVIPYVEGLANLGYKFTILSFEKKERFEQFSKKISLRLNQSNIDWVPVSYTKKPPVLSTVFDLCRMRNKAFRLHAKEKFDLIHCRSYISAFVGLAMKKKTGTKFLFDMRGFYADERVDGNIWNLKNPVFNLVFNYFKRKEREFFKEADYTISLTEIAKNIIHAREDIQNQPIAIQVIPCCADLELFSPNKIDEKLKKELIDRFNLDKSDFVLSYLGSIGTWYMLDEMLDFFKCLIQQIPTAKFLFITNEPADNILAKAEKRKISKEAFIILGVQHHEVPTFLSLSDWSIFFILPVFSKQASSPTKQGEIMGMGIPHICNAGIGDVDRITEGMNSGILIRGFTQENYVQAIVEMQHSAPDLSNQCIREAAEKIYSLEKGTQKYAQVYERLIRDPY